MPRRESEQLIRVHLWLYESDVEWIKTHHGAKLGFAKFVRELVRGFRRKVEARVEDQIVDDTPTLESLNV